MIKLKKLKKYFKCINKVNKKDLQSQPYILKESQLLVKDAIKMLEKLIFNKQKIIYKMNIWVHWIE